jgi:hypothetical protein
MPVALTATMPFTPYQSSFDPDTLRALRQAFDMALAEVLACLDEH